MISISVSVPLFVCLSHCRLHFFYIINKSLVYKSDRSLKCFGCIINLIFLVVDFFCRGLVRCWCRCVRAFLLLFVWIVILRWCVIKTWLPRSLTLSQFLYSSPSLSLFRSVSLMSISMAWIWFWFFGAFQQNSELLAIMPVAFVFKLSSLQNRYQWSCGIWWFHNTTTIFSLFSISRSFSTFTAKFCSFFACVSLQQRNSSSTILLVKFNANLPTQNVYIRCLTTPTIGLHAAVQLTQAYFCRFKNEQCHLMKSEQQKFANEI